MGHATQTISNRLDLSSLVDAVVDTRAGIAALQAREARLLASAADIIAERTAERRAIGRSSTADIPLREVSAEIGAALRMSDRTVQGRIGDAVTLVTRFSATLAAWEDGRVDAAHVSAILDAGAPIDDDEARSRFELRALEAAASESGARLRSTAAALAARIDPAGTEQRMTAARARRRIRVTDLGDGLARLTADLESTLAHAIEDRLTQLARAVRDGSGASSGVSPEAVAPHSPADRHESDEPDARSIDQVRADILCDLTLAGGPVAHGDGLAAITARVQVTVPALTLAGRNDGPALLAGAGPIDLESARRLAGASTGWDRVLTDPFTGAVLAVDRYRPSAALTRHLAARDERCRFPGCRRAARGCDLDHTVDAAFGGETAEHNLAHLCRRHHVLKHESEWQVHQLGGGELEWISPIGRAYRDLPPATVRFVPTGYDADPPPF